MSDDTQLQVVRGAPDDVELAALVAGLMAAATAAPADHQPHSSAWSDRRRQLRPEPGPPPGPDSWRWSLRG